MLFNNMLLAYSRHRCKKPSSDVNKTLFFVELAGFTRHTFNQHLLSNIINNAILM